MKRSTTVLLLCGLFLLADLLTLKQLLQMREAIGPNTLRAVLALQVLAGSAAVLLAYAILRKSFRRQKRPVSRKLRLEPVRP